MKEKKGKKIILSAFLLILALIIITLITFFIYKFHNEKIEIIPKSSELQTLLDKKYENYKYGITFSYPSSLSKNENSLTNDAVESFADANGNEIVITAFNGDSIQNIIDFEKNKDLPDGTQIKLDIKKEGYITLNSGTNGYCIETSDNSIIFITNKNNITFRFTISYTAGNEKISTDILNSFALK